MQTLIKTNNMTYKFSNEKDVLYQFNLNPLDNKDIQDINNFLIEEGETTVKNLLKKFFPEQYSDYIRSTQKILN